MSISTFTQLLSSEGQGGWFWSVVSTGKFAPAVPAPPPSLKPVLNWANVCSPNILRTVRRTVIRFLIELLVRRTWFGQFEEFTCSHLLVLNWLVMRRKLRPQLAADA